MSYTITNFSQTISITIPDMPPGINEVDTSLALIGKGYPNYGRKTAENFLYLLENFAGPYPGPNNPIEGQLWYDTTDPNHKVLRVRDGINWSNTSGIYQQSDDPRISAEAPARLRAGDIWVDTSNYQLKIFNNSDWTLVGPMITEGSTTGLEVDTLYGSADIPGVARGHPVIKLWADGDIVAIVTNRAFTPRSILSGFTDLIPGINLRKTPSGSSSKVPVLNGTAVTAQNLEIDGVVISSTKLLRKDDVTSRDQGGQVITGKVFFKTPVESINNEIFGQGEYGIVINNQSSNTDSKYIQFYKGNKNAVILNNHPSGSIVLKVNDGSSSLVSAVDVSSTGTIINTPVTLTETLSVLSSTNIGGNLNVNSNVNIEENLTVNGTTIINDNLTSNGQIVVNTATAIVPSTTGVYDIGSPTKYFNQIFVSYIGTSTTGTIVYGKVKGTATSLEYGTSFNLRGQVEANSFIFNGKTTSTNIVSVSRTGTSATIITSGPHNLVTGTSITVECSSSTFDTLDTLIVSTTATSITYYNTGISVATTAATGIVYAAPATFNANLTTSAISSQTEFTVTDTNDLTFLALNTSTNALGKIKYPTMVSPLLSPTGMITAYGSNVGVPTGWLLCNGASHSTSTYSSLYSVIGTSYGSVGAGFFNVPNFTSSAVGSYAIYYIIKT
jgi:hypothetical protein